MKAEIKIIKWLTIFSIAMGFMETAVVVYLRELYYPDGFKFPLIPMDPGIGLVEIFREAATVIMLVGIGILAGKTASLKFAYFIFCFAIWDIFYYIFLYVFLGWPESLLTWDILFLIPVPWVGPVITPCIVALTMIVFALSIVYFHTIGIATKLRPKEWGMLILGSVVLIISFIWDYLGYLKRESSRVPNAFSGRHDMFSEIKDYVPVAFNWPLFIIGELILIAGICFYIIRLKEQKFETAQ